MQRASTTTLLSMRSYKMARDEEIDELRQKLDLHVGEFRLHILECQKIEERTLLAQEANTASIAEITTAVKPLVDALGAANTLQRFIKWVTGFSGIAILLAWWNDLINIGSGS